MPSKRQAILSYSHEHDYAACDPANYKYEFLHTVPMCLLYAGVCAFHLCVRIAKIGTCMCAYPHVGVCLGDRIIILFF